MKKALITWMLMIVLCSAMSTATSLNLIAAYTMGNTSFIDEVGGLNGTNNNVKINTTGGINGNFAWSDGASDSVNLSGALFNQLSNHTKGNYTLCYWEYPNDDTDNPDIGYRVSASNYGQFGRNGNDNIVQINKIGGVWQTAFEYTPNHKQLNSWNHLCQRWNSTHVDFFVNGTEVANTGTDQDSLINRRVDWNTVCFFATATGAGTCNTGTLRGALDEIYLYNRSLNDSEIVGLQTSFYPFAAAVTYNSSIGLLFTNESNSTNYIAIFDEGEEFNVWINWTNQSSGEAINDTFGTCNATLIDALIENDSNNTNFTICSSGCNLSLPHTENFSSQEVNGTMDFIHFDGCSEQSTSGSIDVWLDCGWSSQSHTISSGTLPACSAGTSFFIFNFSGCANSTEVNLTINASSIIPFSQRKRISSLAFDRQYANHTHSADDGEIFFNSTVNLWQLAHLHEYYGHGIKSIYANCTNNNTGTFNNSANDTITIVNAAPRVSISQFISPNASIISLTNGVLVEFLNGTYQLLVSIVDDDLNNWNVSLHNSSQLLINWTGINSTFPDFLIDSSYLVDFDSNPFNITVFANDTGENTTYEWLSFNMSDTDNPSCNFSNSTGIQNANFAFSVLCTDENFFSLNVTCPSVNFTNVTTGLNVVNFSFTDSFNLTNTTTCNFRYCDGHTNEVLERDWKAFRKMSVQSDDTLEFVVDSRLVSTLRVVDGELEFEENSDRFKFKAKFDDVGKPYQTMFYYPGENSYDFFDLQYPGWVVDHEAETWFDLVNEFGAEVVTIKNFDYYELRILTDEEEVWFESIGELNCVNGSVTITAVPVSAAAFAVGECTDTTAGVLTLWLLAGLCALFIFVGFNGLGISGIFGGMGLMALSWYVVGCITVFGWVVAGAGMFYVVYFAFFHDLTGNSRR